MEEKKKEPTFIRGVELVDLDDHNVLDMKLHCNSNGTDDDNALKSEGMDVDNSGASSLQCLEPKLGPAEEPVPFAAPVYSDRSSEATPSVHDLLFNAVGKALHPDAMIVKQEAGWFQLREEKWQRKTTEKLALQQEKEQIAKEREDNRQTIAYMKQFLY